MQEVGEAVSAVQRIPTADGCRLHRAVPAVLLHPYGVPVSATSEVHVPCITCHLTIIRRYIQHVYIKHIHVYTTCIVDKSEL